MSELYLLTERVHYMHPNVNFGIALEIKREYSRTKIEKTLAALTAAHRILSSVILEDADGRPYYAPQSGLQVPVIERHDAAHWLDDYAEATANGWNLRQECLLKVIAYNLGSSTFAVFAAHHLLGDGLAVLQLALSFAKHYALNEPIRPVHDVIIASAAELPSGFTLNGTARSFIDSINRSWQQEHKKLNYSSYRLFEQQYIAENPIQRKVVNRQGSEYSSIISSCKERQISVNDYLVAKIMTEYHTNNVTIGVNIRKHLNSCPADSLGNFSGAYSITVDDITGGIYTVAAKVKNYVSGLKQQHNLDLLCLHLSIALDPALIDAAASAALGFFDSPAAAFAGDTIFGLKEQNTYTVTNLGKVQSDCITAGYLLPPCSPSNKIIAGVLTVNDNMNIVICRCH